MISLKFLLYYYYLFAYSPYYYSEAKVNTPEELEKFEAPSPTIEDNAEFDLCGRRIVDIKYFIQQMQLLNDHEPLSCNLSHMKIMSETRRGLKSCIKFKCSMCNLEKNIWSEEINSTVSIKLL